jgi:hypothetical protein
MAKFNRPVIVGEFGGYWMGNNEPVLKAELRMGTWAMAVLPMAGNTGYWWWPYVHFTNHYDVFRAVRNFMNGQDRRKHDWRYFKPLLSQDESVLRGEGILARDRADMYIYQYSAFQDLTKFTPLGGASARVTGLIPGKYRVEYWDCDKGTILQTKTISNTATGLPVPLPTLQIDIAVRVRPAGEARK